MKWIIEFKEAFFKLIKKDKKKTLIISVLAVIVFFAIFGFFNLLVFSDDDMFLEYKIYPEYGDSRLMFASVYQFYGDGRLIMFAEPYSKNLPDEICRMEVQLGKEDIKILQDTISKTSFMSIYRVRPEDVYGGNSYYIKVITKTRTHRIGGYEPVNSRFWKFAHTIESIVPEDINREMYQNIDVYMNNYYAGEPLYYFNEEDGPEGRYR